MAISAATGPMAVSDLGFTGGTTQTATFTPTAGALTPGSTIIATFAVADATANPTITDNTPGGSLTWVLIGTPVYWSNIGNRMGTYYAKNPSSSAASIAVTATYGTNKVSRVLMVEERTGIDATTPVDNSAVTGKNNSSTAAPTSNAFTTTANGDLIYSFASSDGGTLTAGSGYTRDGWATSSLIAVETQIQTTAGSTTVPWVQSGTQQCLVGAVTFKAATGGGGGTSVTPGNLASADTIASPTLTQHNVTTPGNLAAADTIASPTLTQHNVTTVNDLAAGSTITSPTLTQHNAVTPGAVTSADTIDSPILTQHNVIAPANETSAVALDSPSLTQHNVTAPADLASSSTITSPSLTLKFALAPADETSAVALDSPSLTQHGSTAPADLASSSTIVSPSLTQHNVTAPAGLASSSTITSPTLTQHNVIAPANLNSASAIGSPTILPSGSMAVDGLVSGSSLTSPTLTQHGIIAPDAAVAGSTITSPTLTQHGSTAPSNLASGSSITSPTLVQHNVVAPADLNSQSGIGSPGLSISGINPNSLAAGSTLTSPTLTQHNVIHPDDAVSASTIVSPPLLQTELINPTDMAAGSTITSPTLTQHALATYVGLAGVDVVANLATVAVAQNLAAVDVLPNLATVGVVYVAAMTNMTTGDTAPSLALTLKDGNQPANLTGALEVKVLLKNGSRTIIRDSTAEPDASGSVVMPWEDGELDSPGQWIGKVRVTDLNNKVRHYPASGSFTVSVDPWFE